MSERNGAKDGGPRFDCRIGINVGDSVEQDEDIVGDGVNIAARLEGLNKEYDTSIIVSEQKRDKAGPERIGFELIGEVLVRGLTTPTRIYKFGAS